MMMFKLFCIVVGEGNPFPVDVSADETVSDLKKKIKGKMMFSGDADGLKLYLAWKNGAWLSKEEFGEMTREGSSYTLESYVKDILLMNPLRDVEDYLATNLPQKKRIHVLVVVPESAVPGIWPSIAVADLLQQHSLPPGMEFMEAMKQPVGFKIPIFNSQYVTMWPETFTLQGKAEYGCAVDSFLEHTIVSSSEMAVTAIDAQWLILFLTLCGCTIYQDASHESNSHYHVTRHDTNIVKGNVLVGKCEAKASVIGMAEARKELTERMADDAFRTFPRETTSIPAWTTSSSLIHLHQLSYLPSQKIYTTKLLKFYHVGSIDGRHQFVVDLFKILKWLSPIQAPNAFMQIFPGVLSITHNGHFVTWLKAGLVKTFRDDAEIDMEVINKIYNADLQHVERGYCNGRSVTITSIGQTLKNALVDFPNNRDSIIDQVKCALEELHSMGVAHCDVRAANVFVLFSDNRRVILGDLEYCRPLNAKPPNVERIPKNKACKTALELDQYQFGLFMDELAHM